MSDIFELSGRVALVTGCSGGLGVQMAKALAARGANLVIIARRYEKLVEVKNTIETEFGVQVLPLQCDITNTEAVESMVDEALQTVGRIDIVVNNAGTGAVAPAEDITDAQFENEMQIDLFGTFRVARAVAKKSMIPNHYGRVINIASMYGLVGNKIAPASPYHAAKGGVVNLTCFGCGVGKIRYYGQHHLPRLFYHTFDTRDAGVGLFCQLCQNGHPDGALRP